MQQLTDPYRALGVSRAATDAEIKAAHRKLVKRYHPDTGTKSETERFLRVQEAYRVLSDPLLRKDWDLKPAPGPVRADRPAAATPRPRRQPAPKPATEPAETPPPPRADAEANMGADPRTQPRSSRAYTWSASEVPWWEEARSDKKRAEPKPKPEPDEPGETAPTDPPTDASPFAKQDFDVYNRSSGAAWSMAARAYFRKGEQELPRRGSFRRQGTQVVTAGRARSAAEADAAYARRRAAAAAAASAAGAEATYAHAAPPPRPGMGTTHVVRRTLAEPWPSMLQRFGLALVAWLPIAALTTYATQ
jgi:curved DNA-binding protein CbpA